MLLGLLAGQAYSQQTITGKVVAEGSNEPLPAANVYWLDTTVGGTTGLSGEFAIALPPGWPARLVASFVGYKPDTLLLIAPPTGPVTFTLRWAVEMGPVDVVERVQGTQLSTRTINATEVITQKELKRAACCDLSESFETNATVDVSFSDAVSGTKTIRMLGLDGKYAQISVENIPFIRGLSTASGLTLLPGTWIKDINLSKGIGTAVNGPNAMTGQIDLCLVNPLSEPPLFVNLYGNSQGRMEANVHTAQATGRQSANLLVVHGNWMGTELDQNKDGFMDMPMTRRINVMDRWLYQSERRSAQVALRFVDDLREGGQLTGHVHSTGEHAGHGPDIPYDINIRNRMVDVLAKHGTIFANDPAKSIGFIVSGRRHDSQSTYGIRQYDGLQQSFYANAVFQQLLGKGTDQLKTGLAFQFDDYRELFTDTIGRQQDLGRVERMPGAFAEYTRMRNGFTLVAGLRADANDRFGHVVSPRVHAKFDLGPLTTARFSVGHGFRTANPLVENAAVMASSRRVIFEDELGMERSWNLGASLLHKFKWLERKWAVGVDAYRTSFTSQVVADLDRAPTVMAFYMLDGPSFANSALVDVQVELNKVLDLKVSYRYYDVRTTYTGVIGDRLLERPFTPMHRGLVDLAFADRKERWRFDVTLNLFGPSRIPSTEDNPSDYCMPERAPAYGTLHAQITRVVGPWEFYLGGENITSTLQQQQIIAANDPFGPYFDASLIWGPTNKAMIYGGLRFTLNPSKNGPTK
jgi:outer membrane receptor for ferrienterochelin and colicins